MTETRETAYSPVHGRQRVNGENEGRFKCGRCCSPRFINMESLRSRRTLLLIGGILLVALAVAVALIAIFAGGNGDDVEDVVVQAEALEARTAALVESGGRCMQLPDQRASVVATNNDFGQRLYRKLSGSGSNLVVSPYSLTTVLSLTLLGAVGRTGAQIRDVLALPCDTEIEYFQKFKTTNDGLHGNDKFSLDTASRIYVDSKFNLKQKYIDRANNYFDVVPLNLNFAYTEDARAAINDWVESKTNQKIKVKFCCIS